MKEFSDLDYTRDALIKQLGLVQLHGTDGSAVDAGCGCIESKHTYLIEALSEEGMTISTDKKEKEFYAQLSDFARFARKEIEAGTFNMHGLMRETMKPYSATPKHVQGNPRTRAFLPHNLTECEKAHPEVRRKLAKTIKALEVKCCGGPTTDYSKCTCNPVAVARATVPCPT